MLSATGPLHSRCQSQGLLMVTRGWTPGVDLLASILHSPREEGRSILLYKIYKTLYFRFDYIFIADGQCNSPVGGTVTTPMETNDR